MIEKKNIFCVLLLINLWTIAVTQQTICPSQEIILPCRCSQRAEEIQIWCSHSDLPSVLAGIKAVAKTINRPIDELILENNFLPSLPGRAFSPLRIVRLMLRHNGLERVSSGWLNDLEDSLVEIFIVERDIRSVPVESLNGLRRLEAVTIQSENLKRAPDFSGLLGLRYISIQSPSLIELSPQGYRNLVNLETVHITGSSLLTRLESNLFQDLPKLSMINVADNGINWIHLRSLQELPSLKTIILSGNKISEADMIGRAVKDLTNLEVIELDRNVINILREGSFVDLRSLKELYLNDNLITEIHHGAFHRIPNLKTVHLQNNYLRRVHPESFLQTSGSGVEILHLQHNDIGRIEELRSLLDSLPTLKFLDLSYNKLEEIPFGALRGHGTLEQLYLDHNLLRVIERDALMAMPGLRELRLKNNSLTDMLPTPFWNLPGLKGLDLSYNQIRRVDRALLMGIPSLRRIDVSGNNIANLDPSSFSVTPMLETINISRNEISMIHPATFRHLNGLFEVDASYNNLQEMIPGLPRAVERIIVKKNRITTLPLSLSKTLDLPNLRMLDFNSNLLQRIPRSSFKTLTQLRYLTLANNRIQTLDEGSLAGLNRLEILNLQDNRLMGLHERSFSSLADLRNLNIRGNRLEAIDDNLFENLQNLEKLDISKNNINEIHQNTFRASRSLQKLDLSNNNLRELPESLIGLEQLKELDVSFNGLNYLSPNVVVSWRNLEELKASNNKIPELKEGSFKNLRMLQYLDLSSNELNVLEPGCVKNLPELQELVLADNKLADIQDHVFEELPNLQAVHLQQNLLRSISPNSFFRSPSIVYLNLSTNHFQNMELIGLKSVRNLEVLDLSNNGIRRVSSGPLTGLNWLVELKLDDNRICKVQGEPFQSMPRLRVLSMRNNRMVTLPENSFISLRENIAIFDLEGNPLDCSCDMLWLRAWLESDSQNQGPRCRDGTMLRDARISRSDCSTERNSNQLPLTNEHGDQFSRRSSDVDECENDQQNPFPQDSEYFYDQYVDFPINETHLAISNNSLPINLNDRPSLINLNNTLLNVNQYQMNQAALGKPGSQFTFFGMPLPTLNIGRFFNGNRNAKAGPGLGTRGTGRVQIYRPDDPELFKFLQTNKKEEIIEHRNSNIEDYERLTNKPQDDNHLYYRPYFQTPFLEPSVEQGGFTPMMPGSSGGFRPIVNPALNQTKNETKIWPDEYQEIVPLVTESSRSKNPFNFKRGPLNIAAPTNIPIYDQDFDKLKTENSEIISTPEFSSPLPIIDSTTKPTTTTTTTTTTSSTTTTTTVSPTTRSTLQSFISEIKDAETPITESYSDEGNSNQYYTTTPFPFAVPSQKIKENVQIIKESEEKQLNDRSEFWENLNHSPSSLSALVAPGAQQNLFRSAPAGGRSATITKVQPTPLSPNAEEYLRANSNEFEANEAAVTPNSVFNDDSLKNLNGNKNKKTDMDWYFANYNKTADVDFEPGLNRFKSSGNYLSYFSKLYIFVSILVIHYVIL